MTVKDYFKNILLSLDQLGNTLFAGDPDETISSRLGRAVQRGNVFAVVACKVIGFFFRNKNHCTDAIGH